MLAEDEDTTGKYTYYARVDMSGNIGTVFRHYEGPDDVRVEKWNRTEWLMDNDYGRYIYLGDPMADRITAEQALAFIERGRQ